MKSRTLCGVERAVAADDVLFHEDAGEAFLLHVPSGRYFGLNPTGLEIWKALLAGTDPVAALAERWPDVPEATCRDDAARLLGELQAAGLIRPAAEPTA